MVWQPAKIEIYRDVARSVREIEGHQRTLGDIENIEIVAVGKTQKVVMGIGDPREIADHRGIRSFRTEVYHGRPVGGAIRPGIDPKTVILWI